MTAIVCPPRSNIGTKRRQDVDNFNRLALDACSGLMWANHSQILEFTLQKDSDKANPRIELTVLPVGAEPG